MSRPKLNEEIKTRVTRQMKLAFRRLAEARHMNESILQREAYRKFIEAESAHVSVSSPERISK